MSKWIDMSKSNVVETVETKKEHWCFDVYSHETKEHSIFAADTEGEKKQVGDGRFEDRTRNDS